LTLAEGNKLFAQLQYAKISFMPLLVLIAVVVIAWRTRFKNNESSNPFRARLSLMRRVFGHVAVVCFNIRNTPVACFDPGPNNSGIDNIAAELGARHSFRDAAHILDLFVPKKAPHNHAAVRSRQAAVSDQIAARDQKLPHRLARSTGEPRHSSLMSLSARASWLSSPALRGSNARDRRERPKITAFCDNAAFVRGTLLYRSCGVAFAGLGAEVAHHCLQ
jgi:hypothetical protein